MPKKDVRSALQQALAGVPVSRYGTLLYTANLLRGPSGQKYNEFLSKTNRDWQGTPEFEFYLRKVCNRLIKPTDGLGAEAEAVFANGIVIGDDISDFFDFSGPATRPMVATVYEQVKDGHRDNVSRSMGMYERIRLQWSQVTAFCRDNPTDLQVGGIGNFFLITPGGKPVREDRSNLCEVSVVSKAGLLQAVISKFTGRGETMGYLHHRFVVPERR